jgi:Arc/MetJ family transcription regulator
MVSFGNASGAVSPVNIALLAQKGSLCLTRPTLVKINQTYPLRAAAPGARRPRKPQDNRFDRFAALVSAWAIGRSRFGCAIVLHCIRQAMIGVVSGIKWCIIICMRTTLNIDDDLLAEAQKLTGEAGKTALVRLGLRALIEREAAKRLARLGRGMPKLKVPPRRR